LERKASSKRKNSKIETQSEEEIKVKKAESVNIQAERLARLARKSSENMQPHDLGNVIQFSEMLLQLLKN